MIRPLHRRTIEHACAVLKIDADNQRLLLRRWGNVDKLEDLGLTGYGRLIDHLILQGVRTRNRPILASATYGLVAETYNKLGASKHTLDTDLRRRGVTEIRDLDGHQLLDLLTAMQLRGVDIEAFKDRRRAVKPGQIKALGVLRKFTSISDFHYYDLIQRYGGVNTASDLDQRGYRLAMLCLEDLSGTQTGVDAAHPALADRPGFASPQQLALIQALWCEWAGTLDEAALNKWLERSHHVSALRFLTAGKASQAITALKHMKHRKKRQANPVQEPVSA